MASINIIKLFEEAGTIALEITTDEQELAAGQAVELPKVQVGSIGGKPLYFSGTLSE